METEPISDTKLELELEGETLNEHLVEETSSLEARLEQT